MTIKAMTDFAAAAKADSEMTRGLLAALGDKQGDAAAEAFAAYAQTRGFAVTREDAQALQHASRQGEGALSDDQLDEIAGGFMLEPLAKGLDWLAGAVGQGMAASSRALNQFKG
jgi:hypothetical protein